MEEKSDILLTAEETEATPDGIDTAVDSATTTEDNGENHTESAQDNVEESISAVNYEDIARRDISELKAEFPELSDTESIAELENPIRYAALRDLGLSPSEAYLATTKRRIRQDNRAHLERSVPRAASIPRGSMSDAELRTAREIFSDISDAEIRSLYKRVTQ